MSPSPLKRFIFALLLCSAPLHAAEHPRYAVISLVGDQLTIVTQSQATGSRLDNNPKQTIQSGALALDDQVLEEIDSLMPELVQNAETSLLGIRSPSAYQAGEEALQHPLLKKALEQEHPDRIILIRKYRGEARLSLLGETTGNGYLQGLGFYIDNRIQTRNIENGDSGDGFIAPYAYIRMSLHDGKDFREIRTLTITDSHAVTAGRASTGKAWDALSAEEKLILITELTLESVRTHLPKLLAE